MSRETRRDSRNFWRASLMYLKTKYEVAFADLDDEMKSEVLRIAYERRLRRGDLEKLRRHLLERFATWKLASAAYEFVPDVLYKRYSIVRVPPSTIFDNETLHMSAAGIHLAIKEQGVLFVEESKLHDLFPMSIFQIGCLIDYMWAADDEGWAEDQTEESAAGWSKFISAIMQGIPDEGVPRTADVVRVEQQKQGTELRDFRGLVEQAIKERGADRALTYLSSKPVVRWIDDDIDNLPIFADSKATLKAFFRIPPSYNKVLYHLYFLNPGVVVGYLTALWDDGMANVR
jgi:hypothetical protein